MQKLFKVLSSTALVAVLSAPLPAQASEPDANTVVATVNGVDITLSHMIVAMASLPEQYQNLDNAVLYEGILEQLIQQAALEQSFEGDIPPRVVAQLENERRSLVAAEVIEAIMESAVTEEEVQDIYEADYASADPSEEYNASHILVETEEEAIAIKAELDGGADFAAVAREKSVGPSGPGGGSLGWFGPGMMVPSFEAATIALKPGEISDPVQTQFGWHVILLNEVRNQAIPELEDVRQEIETTIRRNAAEAAIREKTEAAEVVLPDGDPIDPAIIRNLSLLDN